MSEPKPQSGESIDLHRIDTPFAHTRVDHPGAVRQLIASIEANGQQVPVIAVQADERLVLVDGYRRWQVSVSTIDDAVFCTVFEGRAGMRSAFLLAERG